MTLSVNVQLTSKVKQRLQAFGRQRSLSLEAAARAVIEEHLALDWQAQAAQQTWEEFQAGSEEATWAELVGRGRWVVAESRSSIRVRISPRFVEDYEEQLWWLGEAGRFEDQARLEAALARAEQRLRRFPLLAPPVGAVRRLVTPGLPFVIWYSYFQEHRQLTLLRLFHQAQRGARPASR